MRSFAVVSAVADEPPTPAVEQRGPDRGWSRADVVLFLLAALVLTFASAAMAGRLAYAPDESSHLTVVEALADDHRLATADDFRWGAERGHGYHLYSPIPYLPYVPAWWLDSAIGTASPADDPVVTRLGGATVAVAQLAATLALVRRLAPTWPRRSALAVAFSVNLLPELRYLHAYVNTDAVTVLAASCCALVALRVLQRQRLGLVDGVWTGLAVALAAHSRYHALVPAAVALVVLLARAWSSPGGLRDRLRIVGVALALPVLLALPSHLGAYREMANGQLTVSATHEQLRESTFRGSFSPDPGLRRLFEIRRAEAEHIGREAWMGIERHAEASLWWGRWLTTTMLAGLALAGWARPPLERRVGWAAVTALAALVLTWTAMGLQWPFAAQGRFLVPTGLVVLTIAVSGWAAALGRWLGARWGLLTATVGWSAALGWLLVDGIVRIGT